MPNAPTSIRDLQSLFSKAKDPLSEILNATQVALSKANSNASSNSYLWRDEAWTTTEAGNLEGRVNLENKPQIAPLFGIPVSVKDCFDLAGSPTSCGTIFYRDLDGVATTDSWLVKKLREAGAVITGKTHLHPLAYGITGENPDFGDCLQPGNPSSLTGGSSSGAAASILERSAIAAIGTDTGGSIRVPAALCGIAGYRATLGRGDWTGSAHLAPSFDTIGWLFRDLEDAPILGSILAPSSLTPTSITGSKLPATFAIVDPGFLHDCEPEVESSYRELVRELETIGLTGTTVNVEWWSDSMEIFAAIQASEAATIHRSFFEHFEASIQQRLLWGESIGDSELHELRRRHVKFRDRMDDLLDRHAFLVLPAAPVARLVAGVDHSQTRTKLLRYTTPISLSGMPAVTIPFLNHGKPSGGVQIVASREHDEQLLELAAAIGRIRKSASLSTLRTVLPS